MPEERESFSFLSPYFFFSPSTPAEFTLTFTVAADGYVATNITCSVSSNTLWRADLGCVRLTPR
jgi:hypothetical protein